MAGIIPNVSSGGLPPGSGTVSNNPGVMPSTFNIDCTQLGLPNDCTARITPAQINAIVSELLNLAACMSPDGTWSCASLTNLCTAFQSYRDGTGAGTLQNDILSALNWRNCAGVQHGVVANIPTCTEMMNAISDAVSAAFTALPPEKFLASANFVYPNLVLTLNDGATVTADLSNVAAILTNNTNGTSTITIDGVTACFVRCALRNDVIPDPISLGVPKRIAPRSNDLMPQNLVATIETSTNCSVVVNADGTHTVTASTNSCAAGVWSYTYTVPGAPAPATVSGTVDNAPILTPLSVSGALSPSFTIITENGDNYQVNWGDGGPVEVFASGATATHTYPSAFTGNIVLSATPCSPIISFISDTGTANFSFNVGVLPSTLQVFSLAAANTTRGNIANLPNGLLRYLNYGSNTTFGDIALLPPTLARYDNQGNNTTSGEISALPAGMARFVNLGNNTTFGSVALLPASLTAYSNGGMNTTTGNISGLPAGLQLYINDGLNTTSGNIASLPAGLTRFSNGGNNTTSGNIASLPAGLTVYTNFGLNTTTGSIATLPVGLTTFSNFGLNTTSGSISTLPATLTYYGNSGNNTTSGNISSLPSGLTYYLNDGNNTTTATSAAWPMATANFSVFINRGTTARTQAVVDFMLQAAANVVSWANEKTVDVAGVNATPGAAGLAAKTTILANGALVVLHN